MKTWRSALLTVMAAGLPLGASVAGCIKSPSTVFVQGALAPPTDTSTSALACTYTASQEGPFLTGGGVLDVGFANAYTAAFLVGNQLISRADLTTNRVETGRVLLQGAVVRITDVNGNEVRAFTTQGSSSVEPASGGSASYGVFTTVVVDSQTATQLRSSLAPRESRRFVANVSVFGTTLGNLSMQTVEFPFPITVCLGCLVAFPPDSVDQVRAQAEGKTNCGKASSATIPTNCNAGQDLPIDCRSCQGNPLCDPTYGTTVDGG